MSTKKEVETNFEALSALSLTDLITIKDRAHKEYVTHNDLISAEICRIVTKEYYKRLKNIFTT